MSRLATWADLKRLLLLPDREPRIKIFNTSGQVYRVLRILKNFRSSVVDADFDHRMRSCVGALRDCDMALMIDRAYAWTGRWYPVMNCARRNFLRSTVISSPVTLEPFDFAESKFSSAGGRAILD